MHSAAYAVMMSITFVYCVEMAEDTTIAAMECKLEMVAKVPFSVTSNDLEFRIQSHTII